MGDPQNPPQALTDPPCLPPQVPFTYVEHESNGKLWPGIHRLFGAVERFQVVNSYGLFRRMTGVGGRPEVVLEGSHDGHAWTVRGGHGWARLDGEEGHGWAQLDTRMGQGWAQE